MERKSIQVEFLDHTMVLAMSLPMILLIFPPTMKVCPVDGAVVLVPVVETGVVVTQGAVVESRIEMMASGAVNGARKSGSNGPGGDSTRGWGGKKNGDGSNDGVWHASGNNAGRRGRRSGGRDHGPVCGGGGGRSSSWGGTKEGQNGGNFGSNEGVSNASGNNVGGCGLRGGVRGNFASN
ncbi:hypothetical protein CRYUN_Cryun09bG0139600 [Craigia yunnanensis]